MSRRITVPIIQTRTIGELTMSNTKGADWRGEALVCIAEHIRQMPAEAPDHYEVHYDGLVLEVGLNEEISHEPLAQPAGDVAWDDPDLDPR